MFDFFSGCGGTSAGLQDAGMEIVFALDFDVDAAATFKANFPKAAFFHKDVTKMRADSITDLVGEDRTSPILFCGCAPCQPFSQQNGRRSKTDHRIPLLAHFARFVKFHQPDFVLVENVPGIQKVSRKSGPLPSFLRILKRLHYSFAMDTVDCCDYGVPQKRKRFVLLASKLGSVSLPPKTHGPGRPNPSYSTVGEWILGLPKLAAGENSVLLKNHRAASLSPTNLARIKATPIGGGRKDWPVELQLKCHADHDGHTDVYGRLRLDQPASALTTRCISLSNGRFGHPTQARAISVREAAKLQTFDDGFGFSGSLNSMARQIGNAVPVLFAKRLGETFVNAAQEHQSELSHGDV
ncbi:MAG: dcm [Acidobacteriaceae bacterium]|nr:dcm [Acidobacteriaceae bacterium]